MTTNFTTHQIKGKGRGKFMGYPTINMMPPVDFELTDGIYAVWVTLDDIAFKGAMHWGPIPTFEEEEKSLEVFILGLESQDLSCTDTSHISIQIVQRLRDIVKFASVNELTKQIDKDVAAIRHLL